MIRTIIELLVILVVLLFNFFLICTSIQLWLKYGQIFNFSHIEMQCLLEGSAYFD